MMVAAGVGSCRAGQGCLSLWPSSFLRLLNDMPPIHQLAGQAARHPGALGLPARCRARAAQRRAAARACASACRTPGRRPSAASAGAGGDACQRARAWRQHRRLEPRPARLPPALEGPGGAGRPVRPARPARTCPADAAGPSPVGACARALPALGRARTCCAGGAAHCARGSAWRAPRAAGGASCWPGRPLPIGRRQQQRQPRRHAALLVWRRRQGRAQAEGGGLFGWQGKRRC